MNPEKWYEHSDKRICKYWLQREICRDCLFDNLCSPEDKKQDINKGRKKEGESAQNFNKKS